MAGNKVIFNDSYVRNLPIDQLEALINFLYKDISSGMEAKQLRQKLDEIKKERRPGVVIETACGEEHFINTTQKVTEIRVNGKVIYRGLDSKVKNDE